MRTWKTWFFSLSLAVLAGFPARTGAVAEPFVLAGVGTELITRADLDRIAPGAGPEERETVLEQLIRRKLLALHGRSLGIRITERELRGRLIGRSGQFESLAAFHRFLEEEGIPAAVYERDVREVMLAERVIDLEVRALVEVDSREAGRFIRENEEELSRAAVRYHLEAARFASPQEVPGNPAILRGFMDDLGVVYHDDIPPGILPEIAALAPGQVTRPIYSPEEGQWLVFRLVSVGRDEAWRHRAAGYAHEVLARRQFEELLRDLLLRLEEKYPVRRY